MNYPNAASGLKTMLAAQILTIVGSIIAVVGVVLTIVSLGILFFVPMLGGLLAFVGGLLEIWGLFKAGADDEGYRGALLFAVIAVVAGVVGDWVPEDAAFLQALMIIVNSVLTFLVVNAVCQTTGNLLRSLGNAALEERANTVSKLYFICTAITVICTIVGAIPLVNILAGLASFVGAIITIVGYFLYLGFLSAGSRAL